VRETVSPASSARPDPAMEKYLQRLSRELDGVAVVDVDRPPAVRRDRGGFSVAFQDGSESFSECLLVAAGLSLQPKPSSLPEEAEILTVETTADPSERVAFLMDCGRRSDPALGMNAIELATRHVLEGGKAAVFFQHAPVAHLFGETQYDRAKQAGVPFFRFGDTLPAVVPGDTGASAARFRVSAKDVIDSEETAVFDCDRVIVVTGPDASSIPGWALEPARGDRDDRGFLQSESVHCHSGASWGSGVFFVGESTGNLDPIRSVAQARAAAARALAWMSRARAGRQAQPAVIGEECRRCLTCYRVCPHAAISVHPGTSRSRLEASPAFCRECGICAAVCPSSAISMTASVEDLLASALGEVVPSNIAATTFVFGCQRSAGAIAGAVDLPEHVRFLAVPCAGSVSEYAIWSALAAGARGVLVVGCHHGNCASHTGTDWAAARVQRALQETGILRQGSPRLGFVTVAANEPARFKRLVTEFVAGHPADQPGTDAR
jgi:quinone-modifying oxidoreductase, subunit QmoB